MCKRKSLPEEKYDDELPAGSGYDYYLSPLAIDGYLQMGDVISGSGSINSHILSQQYLDFNNGGVRCGNRFINSHNISQFNGSRFL